MKHKLTRKLLLKATLACIILTVVKYLFDRFTTIHPFSRTDLELIAAWIVVGIGWSIYLIDLIRIHKKRNKSEPWKRKEKDP